MLRFFGRKLRVAQNQVALQQARLAVLHSELQTALAQRDGLQADMLVVLDKVERINATHRLIPREIAPKFQARARMFSLETKDGLDV